MKWEFWIDRGGTFTDIVARCPDGSLVTHKLLSDNPEQYHDAAVAGIRHFLGINAQEPITPDCVDSVRMGTTVATNALLERKGEPTLLITTRGFGDALRIAYQNRPRLFDRKIVLPEMLYSVVTEIDERVDINGSILLRIDEKMLRSKLQAAFNAGFRATAIVFMHGWRYPTHEKITADIARQIGFTQVSTSHETSPLIKFVSRGDTTVVDAYLSPILHRYVNQVISEMPGVKLLFMQSGGGLTEAHFFHGKDAILSGPAGGIVGMARTAEEAGYDKVIGFDMGGTSTDVSHYAGNFERVFDTQIAGVRLRTPMLSIHTVAAGGSSILHFDGARMYVGPDSAGANPGPACYRRGGPLTITDANVMLGRIQPVLFPAVFGPDANQRLDTSVVSKAFNTLASEITEATGQLQTPESVAEGYLDIAIQAMAGAIKRISVARGHDLKKYALQCFGGAGAQHACRVANALGMDHIFIHRFAGVLSAYGMGMAEQTEIRLHSVEMPLATDTLDAIGLLFEKIEADAVSALTDSGVNARSVVTLHNLHLRYSGTDNSLVVEASATIDTMRKDFETLYNQRFGHIPSDCEIIVEAISVEARNSEHDTSVTLEKVPKLHLAPVEDHVSVFLDGTWHETALVWRDKCSTGHYINGPAIIADNNTTVVLELGWQACITEQGNLNLTRVKLYDKTINNTGVDPIQLEVFNNLFMNIAEQMGEQLKNTAASINIKERLDFSCALFDGQGRLIANAPHMPVHLGSMGESVQTIIRENSGKIRPGDVYMLNDPYHGGTHLPDITVVTPVFNANENQVIFYVASRGHHTDIGGITPGSMPPHSSCIEEEGVVINNFKLVDAGQLLERETLALLGSGSWPARNPQQNIFDLKAQISANAKGIQELRRIVNDYGLEMVQAYMEHVQSNAEASVRRVIKTLRDGKFSLELDNGAKICVAIRVDRARQEAVIDFSGTSSQRMDNFNAPRSVTIAAVLYVFRTLVENDIPLNAGCLKPLKIIIPSASMLDPEAPAAVVAGNVETSMCITNALYGALGLQASSQCTVNNLTFGNAKHQYYETIAGGSGAGGLFDLHGQMIGGFDGTSVVQTHMTNSRLTDPEVLELNYPVRLESYEIRHDSGGKGQWHGGDGGIRRMQFLEPMTVSVLSNGRRIPSFGMSGGQPGKLGINRVVRINGENEDIGSSSTVEIGMGDILVIETPGGGGFGSSEQH